MRNVTHDSSLWLKATSFSLLRFIVAGTVASIHVSTSSVSTVPIETVNQMEILAPAAPAPLELIHPAPPVFWSLSHSSWWAHTPAPPALKSCLTSCAVKWEKEQKQFADRMLFFWESCQLGLKKKETQDRELQPGGRSCFMAALIYELERGCKEPFTDVSVGSLFCRF